MAPISSLADDPSMPNFVLDVYRYAASGTKIETETQHYIFPPLCVEAVLFLLYPDGQHEPAACTYAKWSGCQDPCATKNEVGMCGELFSHYHECIDLLRVPGGGELLCQSMPGVVNGFTRAV